MNIKKIFGYGLITVILALTGCGDVDITTGDINGTGDNTDGADNTAAHVHQWGEYAVTTPATCSATGLKTRTCALDSTHKDTEVIPIDPDAHDWDDKEVITAATCIATGEEVAECKLCGVEDDHHTIPIDSVNGHNWGTDYGVKTPATETTDGIEAIMCTLNNEHFKDDTSRFSGEYATGTAGLAFEAIGSASYRVRKGSVTEGVVHIPAMRRPNATSPYLPVTEIGTSADGASSGAFGSLPGITFISIPENVTAIGANAFYNCTGLTEIAIPASVTTVHNTTFNGCANLRNITIETDQVTGLTASSNWGTRFPADNLSVTFTKDVGATAFRGITRLASVTIAAGVTTIGNNAFNGCTSLASVTIPASVTTIGLQAFNGCTSLVSVTIPASVTTWDNSAFYGCTGLTSVTLTEGLTSIGRNAFYGCTSLVSVTIPASVTTWGDDAFNGCTNLTSVTLTEGLTSIGIGAFRGCTNLVSVTIPASVTTIGQSAFGGYTGLTSVIIPAGVTTIGANAFWNCTNLTSVTFQGTIASDSFNNNAPFLGDLRDKYLAAGGGIGTYTRAGTGTTADPYVWTKG